MNNANNPDASPNVTLASDTMPFVVLTGENAPAIHLLEIIRIKASPPLLETYHGDTRYALPVPTWSMNEGGKITKWLIGAGAPPSLAEIGASTVEPDILLCPPGRSPSAACARESIRDLQAALYFHPRSGGLILENRSGTPIVYEYGGKGGRDVTLTKCTTQRTLLWKQKNYLRLGEYLFAISFVTDGRDQAYKAYVDDQFNQNIGRLYNALPPSTLLDFIPSQFAMLYRHVAAHRHFPNHRMMAGIDIRTGEPVVLKGLYRDSRTLHDTLVRLEIIGKDNCEPQEGLLKALDIWCKCGPMHPTVHQKDGSSCGCERIDYSVPLAEHSFLSMPWVDVKADDRIRYFRQTLVGLVKLHEMGITHGHVSPTSLPLLTEEGRETSASDEYLLKDLKAVLSVCMRPYKQRTQSLCIAPELLKGPSPQETNKISFKSVAQETGDNQCVDAAPRYESNASLDDYLDPETIEAIEQLIDNNTYDVDRIFDEITDDLPHDSQDEERRQIDIRGMAADVWALAMSWLSALIDLPEERRITRGIHRQLLEDLEEKTNKGPINEQLMALIIRRMLQWEPQKRLSADDALRHPAWDLMMMKGDKKRKRGERARRDSQSPAPGEKRSRAISLD